MKKYTYIGSVKLLTLVLKINSLNDNLIWYKILTTIDYDTIIKGLTVAMVIPPLITPCLVLSPILLILKGAAIEYNQSKQPNRDELYLSYLWNNTSPERIIGAIKPVEKYIPFSGIIIKGVETFMDTF